jgi:hypothetical protein
MWRPQFHRSQIRLSVEESGPSVPKPKRISLEDHGSILTHHRDPGQGKPAEKSAGVNPLNGQFALKLSIDLTHCEAQGKPLPRSRLENQGHHKQNGAEQGNHRPPESGEKASRLHQKACPIENWN